MFYIISLIFVVLHMTIPKFTSIVFPLSFNFNKRHRDVNAVQVFFIIRQREWFWRHWTGLKSIEQWKNILAPSGRYFFWRPNHCHFQLTNCVQILWEKAEHENSLESCLKKTIDCQLGPMIWCWAICFAVLEHPLPSLRTPLPSLCWSLAVSSFLVMEFRNLFNEYLKNVCLNHICTHHW